MPRCLVKYCIWILVVLFVSGCVTAKTYYVDKAREDQEMKGNAGYISGTPVIDRGNVRPTKRTYVLEIQTKAAEEEDIEDIGEVVPEGYVEENEDNIEQDYVEAPDLEVVQEPVLTEDVVAVKTKDIEYTVQKNDTLQKISKKFYDGYSKWPRIYEANKDKIKNPNRIKPGIVIVIPGVEQ